MTIRKPNKLKPEQLQHPKGEVRAWNGDLRKPRSNRWNGSPDMEDTGWISRGNVSVTEGTTPPSNAGEGLKRSAPLCRTLDSSKPVMTYSPGRGPTRIEKAKDAREASEQAKKPLTDRQKRQLKGR